MDPQGEREREGGREGGREKDLRSPSGHWRGLTDPRRLTDRTEEGGGGGGGGEERERDRNRRPP